MLVLIYTRRYNVIVTTNSTINREELLYVLRGGRLDDKVNIYFLNNSNYIV